MRIFLIGFMGVGKSTLGRILARELSLPFIDLDLVIGTMEGQSISEIFAQKGEEAFRLLERQALLDQAKWYEHGIYATGGGLPCQPGIMNLLKGLGGTVYLHAPVTQICARLLKGSGRPLVAGKTASELAEYVELTLAERESFYQQADVQVSLDLEVEKHENVQFIREHLVLHWPELAPARAEEQRPVE